MPAVCTWARKQGFDSVKGLEGFNRAAVSGPTFVDATLGGKRLRRGARLWSAATATFKTEAYRFLRLERPSDENHALGVCDGPGSVHLPDWIDTEWLKQLVAEQLVNVRNKRGYAHPEWQKMRERIEALDCRVAWIMGPDRWHRKTIIYGSDTELANAIADLESRIATATTGTRAAAAGALSPPRAARMPPTDLPPTFTPPRRVAFHHIADRAGQGQPLA